MAVRTEARRCLDKFKLEYADTLCRVGEVLLSFSSGILTVVTFGTAFWLQATVNKSDPEMVGYHQGLWQNCTDPIGPNGCETISLNAPAYLIAARLFMCLALVAGMCAWVVSIIGLLQHRPAWLLSAAITYLIQGVCMILGLGSFGKAFSYSTKEKTLTSGWSYSVGWLAMVLALMCTLYFLSVAVYRYRNQSPINNPSATRSYAPLAQFESTETGSDDDDDDDVDNL